MAQTYKDIATAEQIDQLPSGSNLFINDDGTLKQAPFEVVSGAVLPSVSEPRKYLTTDETGNQSWEPMLAYKTLDVEELIPEQTLTFMSETTLEDGDVAYVYLLQNQSSLAFTIDGQYQVKIGSNTYLSNASYYDSVFCLGNVGLIGGTEDDMPFDNPCPGAIWMMMYIPDGIQEGSISCYGVVVSRLKLSPEIIRVVGEVADIKYINTEFLEFTRAQKNIVLRVNSDDTVSCNVPFNTVWKMDDAEIMASVEVQWDSSFYGTPAVAASSILSVSRLDADPQNDPDGWKCRTLQFRYQQYKDWGDITYMSDSVHYILWSYYSLNNESQSILVKQDCVTDALPVLPPNASAVYMRGSNGRWQHCTADTQKSDQDLSEYAKTSDVSSEVNSQSGRITTIENASYATTASVDSKIQSVKSYSDDKVNDALTTVANAGYAKQSDVTSDINAAKQYANDVAESSAANAVKAIDYTGHLRIKGAVSDLPDTTVGYTDGDIILVGKKEYLCYQNSWVELGDEKELDSINSELANHNERFDYANNQISNALTGIEQTKSYVGLKNQNPYGTSLTERIDAIDELLDDGKLFENVVRVRANADLLGYLPDIEDCVNGDLYSYQGNFYLFFQQSWWTFPSIGTVSDISKRVKTLEDAGYATKKYVDDSLSALDLSPYAKTVDGYVPDASGNIELKAMRYLGAIPKMPTDNSAYSAGDVMEIEGTIYYYDGSVWCEFSQHISANAAHHRIDELAEDVLNNATYLGIPKDWDHMSNITDDINDLRDRVENGDPDNPCAHFKGYVNGSLPYVEDYNDGDIIVCNNVIYVCCNKVWHAADNASDIRDLVNKTLAPKVESIEDSMVKTVNGVNPDDSGNVEITVGEAFWVTITKDGSRYTADKTYTEIKEACSDGKPVFGKQVTVDAPQTSLLYVVDTPTDQRIIFQDIDGANRKDYYYVNSDGTVSHGYIPHRTLTFTGAVTGSYNGLSDVVINIPAGSEDIEIDQSKYVPTSRTINGYDLSNNITQSANDVGAEFEGTAESLFNDFNIMNNNGEGSIMTRNATQSDVIRTISFGLESSCGGVGGVAIGDYAAANASSVAQGVDSDATGYSSVAIGYDAQASRNYSTAVGYEAVATGNYYPVAVGPAKATASYSTAVGYGASANASSAVSLGYKAEANGVDSMSIGTNTLVNGAYGVAFGHYNNDPSPTGWFVYSGGTYPSTKIILSDTYKTFTEQPTADLVNGVFVYSDDMIEKLGSELTVGDNIYWSETEYITLSTLNSSTSDYAYYRTPFTQIRDYNTQRSTYAMMFGNGYSNSRRNIQTLDWNGNGWFAGNVYVQGSDQNTGAKRQATEEYVSNNYATRSSVANLPTKTYVDSAVANIEMPTTIQHIKDGEKDGSLYSDTSNTTVPPGAWATALGFQTQASRDGAFAAGYFSSATGYYSTAVGDNVTASGMASLSVGSKAVASGLNAIALGDTVTASGFGSVAVGRDVTSSNEASFAEGSNTTASGKYSHAEGKSTKAEGNGSHAEGLSSDAIGSYSHASGQSCYAWSDCSYAQGAASSATGVASHAEGSSTTNADYAHSEGYKTVARGRCQHVQGQMNVEDTEGKYAHIIGNGDWDINGCEQRSNAHTVDWEGNGWYAGTIEANGIILKASTPGCDYRFLLTVDAAGQLSVTKIEE